MHTDDVQDGECREESSMMGWCFSNECMGSLNVLRSIIQMNALPSVHVIAIYA